MVEMQTEKQSVSTLKNLIFFFLKLEKIPVQR